MKFLSIQATNFMSFCSLDYIFPDRGLYFIGGKVLDGTMSSSNGAGKSAIFEILCWGLYGSTIRNADKDRVVNREVNKNCFVEVIAEDNEGNNYIIRRYRKHEKWQNNLRFYKNDKEITASVVSKTQEAIDSALGMSWRIFSTAIVFGEKAKRFIEAGDVEKKEIFDEILMLHYYQQAQKAVNDDLKESVGEKGTIEIGLGESNVGLEEIKNELKLSEENFAKTQEKRKDSQVEIDSKTTMVAELNKKLNKADDVCIEAQKDFKILEEENQKIYKYVEQLHKDEQKEMAELNKITSEVDRKLSPIVFRIESIQKWLNEKGDLPKGERCPFCGQEIDENSVEGVSEHYEKELKELQPQKKELEARYQEVSGQEREAGERWQKKLREIEQTKSELDVETNRQREIIHDNKNAFQQIENNIALIKKEIEYLESDYKDQKAFFEETKKRLGRRVFDYEERIKVLGEKICEINERAKYLEFWKIGFGNQGIKSLLLDEILPALNSKASYYGNTLLSDAIRLEFDTEALLKSGESRDKFNIRLFAVNKEIDYKECSAGEKKRVDVSVLLALQSLIFGRNISGCNLVVFDEVFDSLDSVGVEKVVDLLKEESEGENKTIFVISHISELQDYFDNVLIVEKKDDISYLEV